MDPRIVIVGVLVLVCVLYFSTREHMIMPSTILIPPRAVPPVAPRMPELTVTSPASAPVLRRANPRP